MPWDLLVLFVYCNRYKALPNRSSIRKSNTSQIISHGFKNHAFKTIRKKNHAKASCKQISAWDIKLPEVPITKRIGLPNWYARQNWNFIKFPRQNKGHAINNNNSQIVRTVKQQLLTEEVIWWETNTTRRGGITGAWLERPCQQGFYIKTP